MSSNRVAGDGGNKKRKTAARKKAQIEGASNIVGSRNASTKVQGVVVNVFPQQVGIDDLTDSERELLKRYRQTTYEGRLVIQQVAVLATVNRPIEAER